MKYIFLSIILFIVQLNAFSQLRVGIGLVTTEADDLYCDESFIAGYESAGGQWNGDLSILDTLGFNYIETGYQMQSPELTNEYDMITWNGTSSSLNILKLINNSSKGLQYVIPAGSNGYRTLSYQGSILDPVICGAGYDSNATGYACEFWDRDPYASEDTILNIIQCGKTFTVNKITRVSSSVLAFSFTGDSLNTNGFEHGIAFRISGLAGTDISPLPSGLYYSSYGAANYLMFNINTTSGTIGSLQTPSSGILKLGTSDTRIFIRTSHWNYTISGIGISIYGVNGFSNNPNKDYSYSPYTADGYGDKSEVIHDLGTGTYTGGGHISINTQSYTTPYVAGKIAFIKDSVENLLGRSCSWWEARYRARMTASGNGVYDQYSGYGRINVLKAIRHRGPIPGDAYSTLKIGKIRAERSGYNVAVIFDLVQNATEYRIFCNGVPLDTIPAATQFNYGIYELNRTDSRNPNKYSYVALRDTVMSKESDSAIMPYYYYKKMRIK